MKTSRLSWPALPHRNQTKPEKPGSGARVAILGIGNAQNGDDAVGLAVLRGLKRRLPDIDRLLLLEAGSAPEAFTGLLRRFEPDWVILLDAAWMGLEPGRAAWIGLQDVDGMGAITHGLPLSLMVKYLQVELDCQVLLLGIQISDTQYGMPLSPKLSRAARRISGELARLIEMPG